MPIWQPAPKDIRLQPRPHRLPDKHAGKGRRHCDCARQCGCGRQKTGAGEVEAKRQGRDREEHAQCLDQFFLLHADRLQEWHRRNDLHAGCRRNHAGDQPDDAADPFFVSAGNGEIELAQADEGIDRQQQAERDGGVARIGPGQRSRVEPDAGGRTGQQWPQPPENIAQVRTAEGLPDVGDDRRHDDDGDRLGRRHRHRKQAHRHRRQAEPECALHEAREQEGGSDEEKQGIEHGTTLTYRHNAHNLEITETAFG